MRLYEKWRPSELTQATPIQPCMYLDLAIQPRARVSYSIFLEPGWRPGTVPHGIWPPSSICRCPALAHVDGRWPTCQPRLLAEPDR